MGKLEIRPASEADASIILNFITDLASFENAQHEVTAMVQDLENTLFGTKSTSKALLCYLDGVPVAFAVYFSTYSTWLGRQGLYIEDVFVSEKHRGLGVGTAIFRHIAREALDAGCARLEWSVLDWNESAIGFYASIGAKPQSEWVRYRLSGDDLANFACSIEEE